MKKKEDINQIVIPAPNFKEVEFNLVGISPFVQLKFSEKTQGEMLKKMAEGSTAKKGKKRDGRDYKAEFEAATYRTADGRYGIPAAAFRNACISACRTVGFKMTLAKLSIFIINDGIDAADGTPIVFLNGTPEMCQHHCRNATGVIDIRTRAMWREWSLKLRIRYDGDQFQQQDVASLLMRVGMQVGVGEGRPDSRMSAGMGWGMFRVE